MENAEFFTLQEEFFRIARDNLSPDDEESFSDVIEEARWQVSDWYNGSSFYAKPEDILVDYFFLSNAEAHKFLELFRDRS